MRIISNKVRCLKCGSIIESTSVHDFKWCQCRAVAVDGGHEYLRRIFDNRSDYEELSKYENLAVGGTEYGKKL